MIRTTSLAAPALLLATALGACSSVPPGASPHDMSVREHERAAAAEEAKAATHRAQYDPQARERAPASGAGDTFDSFTYSDEVYNPTQVHLDEAQQHSEHAAAHRAAAASLRADEERECGKFPPAIRATCPLLGTVVQVEDVGGGVRIRVAESLNAQALYDHIRCHLAFAATQGFEGPKMCPLYLKGVRAVQRSDPHTVDLLAEGQAEVAELRARAHRLLPASRSEASRHTH